jgi:hypothetical protein
MGGCDAPGGIRPAGSLGRLRRWRAGGIGLGTAGLAVDWPVVLEAFGVGVLILNPHTDEHLLRQFRARTSWAEDFRNQDAVILVRMGHDGRNAEPTPPQVG